MKTASTTSAKALFNEALQRINQGELNAAAAMCREAIRRDPHDVSMTALLGAVLIKQRQPDAAEKYLREAIDMAPTFAKPHEDLGYLLLETNRAQEAVQSLKEATRLDPESASAFYTLGRAFTAVGKQRRADVAFEKAFGLDPQRKKLAMAAELHKRGKYPEAERIYRRLLQENPRNVDAMRLLAGVASAQGLPEEAESLLRRAIAVAPDFALAHLDLGNLMKDQQRFEEAIECFSKTAELHPHSGKPHYLHGAALAEAGRTYDAVDAYRKAIEVQPAHTGAMLGLGHSLKTIGEQDEAVRAYRECIRLRPEDGEIYWSMANLKTFRFSDEEIASMHRILEQDDLTERSRVHFLFALAKASEDAGHFDQAWQYYSDGNTLQRSLESYDPVRTEVANNELREVFNAELFAEKSGLGNPDPAPIFIVGLPRSGSTLLEQILASHSLVEGTAELPYLGRTATSLNHNRADGVNYPKAVIELGERHLQALGHKYLQWAEFHRQLDKPRFIDKNPNNFANIGLLHLILPNAKIIDARRYPLDTCLSCYRQLFAKGQTFLYDLQDLGEYYLQYLEMMEHWDRVLPGRVHRIQYENLVTDFEGEVRRLLEYCELPWEDDCINFYQTDRPVRTASSEQVRQPVYTKSIHYWRNYDEHLGELKDILAPILPDYAQYEAINRD